MDDCNCIPAPGRISRFSPDEVIFYGIALTGHTGVTGFQNLVGGTQYDRHSPPKVELTGGGGQGARARAEVNAAGAVTQITIVDSGFGYNNPPNVVIDPPAAGGVQATAAAQIGAIGYANLNIEGPWDLRVEGFKAGARAGRQLQIIAAYGYAFEGHCYRFDKPRIFAFEGEDGDDRHIGCGFDLDPPRSNPPAWYRAWRVKSNTRVIELNVSVDDVQKLVLDANLPGRRPPNTYRSDMQMAHRGGRLTGP